MIVTAKKDTRDSETTVHVFL